MTATSSSRLKERARAFRSEDAQLSLRVTDTAGGVLVERDHICAGRPSVAHAMLFCSPCECQAWMQADPLRLSYPLVYVSVVRQVIEWLDRGTAIKSTASTTAASFHQEMPVLIGALHSAQDLAQLLTAFRSTLAALGTERATFAYLFDAPQTMPRLLFLVDGETSYFSYEDSRELIAGFELAYERAMPWSAQGATAADASAQGDEDALSPMLDVPALSAWQTSSGGLLHLTFADDLGDGHTDIARHLFAKSASTTLREWLDRRLQDDFIGASQVTPGEIELLRLKSAALCTKAIARRLHTTPASVNSRFQRLNRKLGTRSRRSSLELAAAHGLVTGHRTRMSLRTPSRAATSWRAAVTSASSVIACGQTMPARRPATTRVLTGPTIRARTGCRADANEEPIGQ